MFSSTFASVSFLLPLPLLFLLHYTTATTAQLLFHSCGQTGNYTANSTYQSNLDQALTFLVDNGWSSGFTTAAVGQIPDLVNGLVLCRGDVNATACRSCLDLVNQEARQLCPFYKEATVWHDNCMIRFSNQLFLNTTDNSDLFFMYNVNNVTDVGRFDGLLSELMNSTVDWASNNSTTRFATGVVSNFTGEFPSIYGLVQCTPDFSGSSCTQCLQDLFNSISETTPRKQGWRAVGSRCNMRYELYSFFQGVPTLKLTAPPNNSTAPPLPAAAGGMCRGLTSNNFYSL